MCLTHADYRMCSKAAIDGAYKNLEIAKLLLGSNLYCFPQIPHEAGSVSRMYFSRPVPIRLGATHLSSVATVEVSP